MAPVLRATLRRIGRVRRHRCKAAILTRFGSGRVIFYCDKADLVHLELLRLNRFVDQVGVAIANVLKLLRWDTNKARAAVLVRKARGLQPGMERLTVDLHFQRAQDA